jgi:DNA-binding CsgD family transcriptional regulator
VLRTIGSTPHPDEIARSIVDAFAETFTVTSAAILTLRGRRLVVFGLYGYPDSEIAAMRVLPVDGDYPISRALREGEVIIDPVRDVSDRYAAGRRLGGSWPGTQARCPDGTLVHVPIVNRGLPVGGFGLVCETERDWDPVEVAALDAIAHALGLWLTHEDGGLPLEEPSAPRALTSRQVAILTLVAEDRSNTDIADLLGYSESTVKQEMQRILRSLEVGGRREAASRATALGLLREQAPA